MNRDHGISLEKLRKLGVIHLEKKNVASDILTELLSQKSSMETALRILRSHNKNAKASVKKKEKSARHSGSDEDAPVSTDGGQNLVRLVLNYADEQKNLQGQLKALRKEQNRIKEWGDFDPRDVSFFAREWNLNLFLYKLPHDIFDCLPEEIRYITLGSDKKFIRLIVFDRELPGKVPFAMSEYSLKEIDVLVSGILARLSEIERRLSVLVNEMVIIENKLKTLVAEIEFEIARAGMDILEGVPRDSAVAWITGFVPEEDMGILKREAMETGWAIVSDDPGPNDNVPTKLKNNRLVRLLNPLTDFLDILPGYREVDISGWFLLFFTLFFGMIFSDAAYGFLFIVLAVAGILKNLKKGVPQGLKLLLLLGCSNFIWGVLTCAWFGLDAQDVPAVLQQISLPQISNLTAAESAYGEGIVRQNMMIFCFTIALLQLSIGRIIAITRNKSLKMLADAGAIAMLIGMYGVILSLIASNEYREIPLFMPCVYLLGVGFILNTVFVNYEGSIRKSVMESLKNSISVILGITNVFSDIMSYLRLWAVGLAGAAIASIIDNMAGPMLGHFFFFIFGVILLVFGHGLNLVLNTLSVLVHGVRLNTLEFSGSIGLSWAGSAYKPFSVHEK